MTVRHELRYRWANGTDPRLIRLHHTVDAIRSARPRVTVSYGEAGAPTIAYAGLDDGLSHVLPFLEQRRGRTVRRERYRASWAGLADRLAPADLVAVGRLPGQPAGPFAPCGVELPFRVNLVAHLDGDPDAVPARLSRKARQQYQRERRSRSRDIEVGRTAADFDFFYDRMHRPTMRRRHGAATRTVSRAVAWHSLFHRGVLFFLRENGERVAGMLCRLEAGAVVLRLAGVRDGAELPYRSGTYLALYVGILEWATRNRLDRVDLSGAEPFLSKGILQFKRKLHPWVGCPATHFAGKRLWLGVRRDTPAVRDFLVANPVLMPAADGLTALYFHDRARPPRLDLRWQTPGVTGHTRVDLDAFLAGISEDDHVRCRGLDRLLP